MSVLPSVRLPHSLIAHHFMLNSAQILINVLEPLLYLEVIQASQHLCDVVYFLLSSLLVLCYYVDYVFECFDSKSL